MTMIDSVSLKEIIDCVEKYEMVKKLVN